MPTISTPPNPSGPFVRLLASETRLRIAETDPREVEGGRGLFPEEAVFIARAVDTRRRQFTAGRLLARRALGELGVAALPLANDEQRVPVWPAGVVGSITHTRAWCAAVVGRSADYAALGIDVEGASPLEAELEARICLGEEREFLRSQPPALAGMLAKAIFSAKESIYKALYPSVRVFLDFQGMRIELRATAAAGEWTWHAELQVPWGGFLPGQRFGPGRLAVDARWIASAIALPPDVVKHTS